MIVINKKGEKVAFVGESGSGKSTLVNIICGLYKPTAGNITINDKNIAEIQLSSYRSKIGYISQEPTIFFGTVYDNVTLWSEKNNKNTEKFWQSVKDANLDEFIKSLPLKENTMIGTNGINLSGGQRQRISIARELYKDIEILIMDEATSALDSQTELEVQKSVDMLDSDVIVISIAHRLSTIANANRIFVMKSGEVISDGTFAQLKKDSEYFRHLTLLQGL